VRSRPARAIDVSGVLSVRSSRLINDQPASGWNNASMRATASRNAGATWSSSRPMPSHCEPLPENTKAVRARGCCTLPVVTNSVSPCSTNDNSRSAVSVAVSPNAARRYGWCARRMAAV
jgi:hypothetical protein